MFWKVVGGDSVVDREVGAGRESGEVRCSCEMVEVVMRVWQSRR